MPPLTPEMTTVKPKLSIAMAGKASAALAATAGAAGGQDSKIGAQKEEPMGSDDDGKPPAASQQEGEESGEEPEPDKGPGYTPEDQELFSSKDLGKKKLLECVE